MNPFEFPKKCPVDCVNTQPFDLLSFTNEINKLFYNFGMQPLSTGLLFM